MAWKCKWCDQLGYWECGEEPPPLCQEFLPGYMAGWEWTDCGTVNLEDGQTYYLKCSPEGSCEALVEPNPEVVPPWKVVGELSVPAPNLPEGLYAVHCRTGPEAGCYVRLSPVEELP